MGAEDYEPVHLGYVGRPLRDDAALDVHKSRLGGIPVWAEKPNPTAKAGQPDFFKCELCKQSMALVGQFSVGYEGAPGRLLHVLVCPGADCGGKPAAWRVLRSTFEDWPSTGEPVHASASSSGYPQVDASADAGDSTANGDDWGVPKTDDWGVPATDDWGVAKTDDWGVPKADDCSVPKEEDWGAAGGDGESPSTDDWGAPMGLDSSADAEIEALLLARSAAPQAGKAKADKKEAPSAKETVGVEEHSVSCGTVEPRLAASAWPCFALEIYNEPDAVTQGDAGEHERELYERYLKGDEAKDDDVAIGPNSTLPADLEAKSKGEPEIEGDGIDEDLDDEDDDGAPGKKSWFSKFQLRLQRSPTQVVRYSWGGAPLWMAQPPSEVAKGTWPPPCGSCGADRCFELQLLPTLAHQMQQAAGSKDGTEVKMEWGTAAVYTCSKDCAAGDFCEEFVVVQAAV